jgi:regulation of enolase protein 1 (concanavalin A-like superfamily)
MKSYLLLAVYTLAATTYAQEAKSAPEIPGWGAPTDPAGDCKFDLRDNKLMITVPGSDKAHDLGAEVSNMTAPRVLQPVSGDFVLTVKIDGEFDPGDESTQPGRTGYNGAGLVVFADENNYVRIERATLNSGAEVHPYTNFEIRVDGQNERFGTTGDLPTEDRKPTWLRLERKGGKMLGAMSHDGEEWAYGKPKELTSEAWNKPEVKVGVAAINTSKQPFVPSFSEFKVKPSAASSAEERSLSRTRVVRRTIAAPLPSAAPYDA